MHTTNKVLVGVVAVVILAALAYYFLQGTPSGESALEDIKMMTESLSTGEQAGGDVPAASDSLDDFGAALEAEFDAQASALESLDADVDASVNAVVNGNETYDPNSI